MKIKPGVFHIVAVFVLAISPVVLMAQRTGFQIGIAQPTTPFLPTQPPAIVTNGVLVTPFAPPTPTVVIIQTPVVAQAPVFIPGQVFPPGQAFAPNPVFIPNAPFVAPAFPTQTPFFPQTDALTQVVVPPHILVPGQTFINPEVQQPVTAPPQSFFNDAARLGMPNHRTPPMAGTSRGDVLRQFGQPSVTVMTSTGETLYFNGGVTVTLQNGQVTGPR